VTVDVQHYSLPNLKEDLNLCLTIFEDVCSKRNSINSLNPFHWPCMFYLLCTISIVQSILIDTYTLRCEYNGSTNRNNYASLHIQSTYHALVSIFTWASGPFDPLLRDYGIFQSDGGEATYLAETVLGARNLVRLDKWKVRNIKSTKDFLMQLGKGLLSDGTFSGFVVQKRGLPHNQTANMAFHPAEFGANTEASDYQRACKISVMSSRLPHTSELSSSQFPSSQAPGASSDTIDPTHFQGSCSYAGSLLPTDAVGPSTDGTSKRADKINWHGLVETLIHTDKDVTVSVDIKNSAKATNNRLPENIMRTSATLEGPDLRENHINGGAGSNSGDYGIPGHILYVEPSSCQSPSHLPRSRGRRRPDMHRVIKHPYVSSRKIGEDYETDSSHRMSRGHDST
jgi:hypothetical protein